MSGEIFNQLTEVYEAMIDWPKRLANEEPLYRSLFARVGVTSLVDVACGTGRHAGHVPVLGPPRGRFRSEPEDDPARPRELWPVGRPPMDRARVRRADRAAGVVRRGHLRGQFPGPCSPAGSGSSGRSGRCSRQCADDGVVVIHVLNLWHLSDGPCVWQKCRRAALPQGDVLILKGVHRCGRQGYVELLVARPGRRPADL